MTTGPLYSMGGAHPNALAKNKSEDKRIANAWDAHEAAVAAYADRADAMSGLATGAKQNVREQDIHTPDCVLDVVRETFGGRIVFDPCASHNRAPLAELNAFEEDDGLSGDWPAGTFFNPPYKNLKLWLGHARSQTEHIGLYPVRTNRDWWMNHHCHSVSAIAWLKPLKFVGFKGAFPAPLVLVYSGRRDFLGEERFERAAKASKLAHAITKPLERI